MELTQNVKNIQEKWDANFMKTYAQIPWFKASIQLFIFGIIPPVIVPFSNSIGKSRNNKRQS